MLLLHALLFVAALVAYDCLRVCFWFRIGGGGGPSFSEILALVNLQRCCELPLLCVGYRCGWYPGCWCRTGAAIPPTPVRQPDAGTFVSCHRPLVHNGVGNPSREKLAWHIKRPREARVLCLPSEELRDPAFSVYTAEPFCPILSYPVYSRLCA